MRRINIPFYIIVEILLFYFKFKNVQMQNDVYDNIDEHRYLFLFGFLLRDRIASFLRLRPAPD